jgi:glutamate-1-semialdehyde 2,1-aminomutase
MNKNKNSITQQLYLHAKEIIPGGTQLLSKRPELKAPDQWPAYYQRADGCEIWDLDGQHYYDFSSNGIGSCLLGYNYPEVSQAVIECVQNGSMSTLNPPEEVELADLLCELHPWAEAVRYARTGGEAMAVAVRIARATTDRSVIAVCGYHGWHDWYLAANLGEDDSLRGHLLPGLDPLGVPGELRNTVYTFTFNNREEFQQIIDKHGEKLAAVVMEPCRNHEPEPGFLEYIKDSIHEKGGLLVIDEITIGWRLAAGGAHLKFGVNPDIAVFAKAIGNGHPMAAIIGTSQAMEGAHNSFISSTYWTERVGPVAALATIRELLSNNVYQKVNQTGEDIKNVWRNMAEKHSLDINVDDAFPCLAHFSFEHEDTLMLNTLFVQIMLQKGFLAGNSVYVTLAHSEEIVCKYAKAVDDAFLNISNAIMQDNIEEKLAGPVAHQGFRRLT